LEPSYVGEKPNNKKEQIISLLSEGKFSVRDIARMVNTTEANVYKEKSKARRLFIRKKTRSDELVMVAGESDSFAALPSQRLKPVSSNNHYSYLNIQDLDADGIKKLYTEFNAGKKPAYIIANHGFHPEVVEKEYQRFLKMNERDIDVFQNKLISTIIKQPSRNTKPFLEKYKTKGFLSEPELSELYALKFRDDYEKQIRMWAHDKTAYLPSRWSRIRCKDCNEAQGGTILNPSFGIGKYIFEQYKDYICDECRNPLFGGQSTNADSIN
jgi:RNase P subunit RPR2